MSHTSREILHTCSGLQPMQGDVQQHGADHPTLRGSLGGGGELRPFDDTGAQPALDVFPRGETAEHRQQMPMIDAVECRRQIGIENPPPVRVDPPTVVKMASMAS